MNILVWNAREEIETCDICKQIIRNVRVTTADRCTRPASVCAECRAEGESDLADDSELDAIERELANKESGVYR